MQAYSNEYRIVFMGDSITEAWLTEDPEFFESKPYINRGISGQTTQEMLYRFQKDVIDLMPSVVVILAGTNDIAENGGPITVEEIHKNIMEMTKLAQTNQIRVVLCSVLPAYDYPWRTGLKPAEKIVRLNEMIRNHARQKGFTYCDYYSSLVDERKGLKFSYSEDGVHPNISGYKIMERIVERAVDEALKQ
jgi:lysophospholipase L1-like esterase